jgi:hypothetical protein
MPNKAMAAGAGSGVAGALATLIIAKWWPGADATVAAALTTVLTVPVAFLSAWLAKFEGVA